MLGKTTPFQQKLLKSLSRSSRSNEGITLLESLVAIIVLTIAVTVVTPPIFLAVATRVQNQKAEQAMQLAQKYVDQVRGTVEQGEYDNAALPSKASEADPEEVNSPNELLDTIDSSNSSCNSFDPNDMPAEKPLKAIKADVNGDCEADFFVQIFRSSLERKNASGSVTAFPMGVRVYAMAAEDNVGSLQKIEALLTPTQGFGQQTTNPLATIYTNVVYSQAQSGQSLNWYKDLLNPSSP